MLNKNQALTLLKMQDSMNIKAIGPDWKNSGHDFLLAAGIEAVEAIDHHGWKWWKAQVCDMPQLHMELVDIMHFVASDILVAYKDLEDDKLENSVFALVEDSTIEDFYYVNGREYNVVSASVVEMLKLLSVVCFTADRSLLLPVFIKTLEKVGLSWSTLYKMYIGKNVLNVFRQDNGYKAGTYQKDWNGKEDNEVLTEILDEYTSEHDDLVGELYERLQNAYSALDAA